MILTLDTNIIVQSLSGNRGASYYILDLFYNKKVDIAISLPVFYEYEDVLNRPNILEKILLEKEDIQNVLRFILLRAKKQDIFFLFRPNLKDEKDNIFIELSLKSNSDYLITNNIRDFKYNNNLKFPSIKIITPSDFVKEWKNNYENKE